ncbi:Mannosylfructose-phosphate synthase [Anaerohalosphaera lusitana]|uniref:Mannosylfructose-phosphate synthase n=1 Tax=Anaerohalosphaera lusitana TaxID=1936003 RepID=A0A1U9NPR4_9BACT|nr:glycosyltransferase [Anaerohalosphaera lusitana]AQT69600.1 Mannosylfructose-phosphate synthase [Anaerohalosphaera lusitana]
MTRNSKKVAFIASYLPKKCGIATFTSDLISNISLAAGKSFDPLIVAMQAEQDCRYKDPVKFEVRQKVKNDYICAADYINFSHVDLVSVQHEFGLFGGSAGSYLNLLLDRVSAPVITTMHTVLEEPDKNYFRSTVNVCNASHRIIVMNKRGIEMLHEIYGIPREKILLVPHGIPDLPFVDSSYYKHKFGMEGRKTILTFGLLSKNKGIELMLRALPEIVKNDPSVLYIILGTTHPSVLAHEGEEYRTSLQRLVNELGLQDHVLFHNQFVNDEDLHNFLCAADIYVTPYRNKEQLTSGTLAFAVGTGKAVVSTPYWAAQELLDEGRGRLVDFEDHHQLAETIVELIKSEEVFYSLRRRAYEYGRDLTWQQIGTRYWKEFNSPSLPVPIPVRATQDTQESVSVLDVPEPPLDHLKRLTDDTGLYQHAKFILPNRQHGYCTDDNTRALIAMTRYYAQYAEPEALRLFNVYLSFVFDSQRPDGTVRNFMTFERRWIEDEPEHDALGRALWAFGAIINKPPLPRYLPVAKDCFDKSVKHIAGLSLRGKAYAIFGISHYLSQFPGASDIKRYLAVAVEHIAASFETYSEPGWEWFEEKLSYDNAALPHAMFEAAICTGKKRFLDIALKSCQFLIDKTYDGDHFSFIGCKGWHKKGRSRAIFDQQPIEVAGTAHMLRSAYDATADRDYLKLQRKAFDWFLGENDLHIPVYDFKTKGSCDGLQQNGVNMNQGAESMVSFLLSLLCIVESYSTRTTYEPQQMLFPEPVENLTTPKHQQIREIFLQSKSSKNGLKKQNSKVSES